MDFDSQVDHIYYLACCKSISKSAQNSHPKTSFRNKPQKHLANSSLNRYPIFLRAKTERREELNLRREAALPIPGSVQLFFFLHVI